MLRGSLTLCGLAVLMASCDAADRAASLPLGSCYAEIFSKPGLEGFSVRLLTSTPELASIWENGINLITISKGDWRLYAGPGFTEAIGDFPANADQPAIFNTITGGASIIGARCLSEMPGVAGDVSGPASVANRLAAQNTDEAVAAAVAKLALSRAQAEGRREVPTATLSDALKAAVQLGLTSQKAADKVLDAITSGGKLLGVVAEGGQKIAVDAAGKLLDHWLTPGKVLADSSPPGITIINNIYTSERIRGHGSRRWSTRKFSSKRTPNVKVCTRQPGA